MLPAAFYWPNIPLEGEDETAGLLSFLFVGVEETFFSCRC